MQLLSASSCGDCKVQEIWDSTCVISEPRQEHLLYLGHKRETQQMQKKIMILMIFAVVEKKFQINMLALCMYACFVLLELL